MRTSQGRRAGGAIVAVALALLAPPASAGQACLEQSPPPEFAEKLVGRSIALEAWLNNQPSRVVLIVRKGQDLDKYGVTFSHGAFAVRNGEGLTWNVYHDLNKCGTDKSAVFVQGLADFLADALPNTPTAAVVPEPWLADRLWELFTSENEAQRMHEAHYSAVAYPYALKYQNSDGWLLETFARAASDTKLATRADAQEWLKAHGYEATRLELGAFTRLGGRMFRANVAFDDHPPELRWNGHITTHSGDSLLRFAARFALMANCAHGKFPEQVCLVD